MQNDEDIAPNGQYLGFTLTPHGSWEFASATIANDACYQGALFALSYWLDRGKSIEHAGEAAKYMLGMHHTLLLLTHAEANAAGAGGFWGLMYDKYDLTALAAMRYSELMLVVT
ncbi:hypothetical protein PInf_015632 [Phytophthora infestans]|nr:hypothetical protein PInf_015632 [Phytophthora infestans]